MVDLLPITTNYYNLKFTMSEEKENHVETKSKSDCAITDNFWDDDDDELLACYDNEDNINFGKDTEATETKCTHQSPNQEKCPASTNVVNDLSVNVHHPHDMKIIPLEFFRPKYLWVSDLTRQNWCEQQLFYSFMPPVPVVVVEKPVMTEGTNLHLARELAVHDVVNVKVTSSEDIWAIKTLNLITVVNNFLNGDNIAREVPIFGAPFDEDVFVVGLIDELRFDQQSHSIDLSELKTTTRSQPSKFQQKQHRLQVMLYKKLFDDLVKGRLTKEKIAKHLRLDLKCEFGEDVQAFVEKVFLSHKNLDGLIGYLHQRIQALTCINLISIEYVHQETKATLNHSSVEYDDTELKSLYTHYLKFWKGERPVEGVDIEEAWKCQRCDFADVCEWRQRKAEEYSAKNKIKL